MFHCLFISTINLYIYKYISLSLSTPSRLCLMPSLTYTQQQLCSYVCTCLYMSVHAHVLALTCTFKYFFKLSTALIITTLNHSLPNSWLPSHSSSTSLPFPFFRSGAVNPFLSLPLSLSLSIFARLDALPRVLYRRSIVYSHDGLLFHLSDGHNFLLLLLLARLPLLLLILLWLPMCK